jgi:hypothetical protein
MSSVSLLYVRRSFASLLGLFVLASVLAVPAHGQVGQASALFLRIEPDSRASGMGNTGVALANDANSMFWNPSGLAFQENTQVGLSHGNWLPEFDANLFYEYLVASHHVEDVGTFGANVTFLNLGTTEIRDAQGSRLGETNSFQLAASASYGVKIGDRFGIGTSARFIHSQLAETVGEGSGDGSASTFATDLSALYRTAPFALAGTDATFSAGLNIANLGGTLDFNEQELGSDPIPASFRFGPALTLDFDEFNTLTIATDFTKSLVSSDLEVVDGDTARVGNSGFQALFDSWGSASGQIGTDNEATSLSLLQQFTVGTGLEYWYNDLFALRTGYYYEHPDNGDRQFVTFGAGLRYNVVGVDMSYLYTSDDRSPLANTLRFSLLFNFQ